MDHHVSVYHLGIIGTKELDDDQVTQTIDRTWNWNSYTSPFIVIFLWVETKARNAQSTVMN